MVEILYLLLAAVVLMLLATRSSFLYPCNDWNDANSYFSVGKALFHGKMPYRDVFDQKGMYLYFFYGLAYLVSHTTFFGVFIMEIILAAFDLVGICRILRLYLKKETALLLSPPVLAVIICSKSFYWGGSAEEVCLPFLIWGLYLSLDYFKNQYPEKTMELSRVFAGGFLAGMVANIKFTGLGFFFAWMMCIAFAFLVKKDLPGAVKACLVFLGGMAVPFLPWVIYFTVRHGLSDWYNGYVYVNVFMYSNLNDEGPGLFERIYVLAKLLYWVILDNLIYFVFIIIGVVWFLLGPRKWLERFNLLSMCFFLFLGIYVGGSVLPYYALPLSVFTVLGFAWVGRVLERLWGETAGKMWERLRGVAAGKTDRKDLDQPADSGMRGMVLPAAGGVLSLLVCVVIIWNLSMNIDWMKEKKEDIFLYQFREIVQETENPTLLNIGCLDAGLYTVCDIVPTCRWFQTQTINTDTVYREQEQYIREGRTAYVLARDSYPDVIWENYELAAQAPWYLGETEFTYYLFRLKE